MEVISELTSFPETHSDGCVALGAFDGIHRGHQFLISRAVQEARQSKSKAGVYTFFPHPRQVLYPGKSFNILTTWEQRKEIFHKLELDFVYLQHFTVDFATQDFREFVQKYLVQGLKVRKVFVGSDFRFGRKGEGDVDALSRLGKETGFAVQVIEPFCHNDTVISSTLIRRKIEQGRVEDVVDYLGRYYSIDGEVIHGQGIGRKLGYPTANLVVLHPFTMPRSGVYGVKVRVGGEDYYGLAHLGSRPTFSLDGNSFEVFLLEFNGDLYGEKLAVSFLCRIRDIMNFANSKELACQIERDRESFKHQLAEAKR
ncbi:MAG: bifunctional riboflavin kinase/FAD synthetase [Halanaerobium sp.]|nr:bifunctional riboflavin kinase/FAD synthetase [Halanaerobium sp.]